MSDWTTGNYGIPSGWTISQVKPHLLYFDANGGTIPTNGNFGATPQKELSGLNTERDKGYLMVYENNHAFRGLSGDCPSREGYAFMGWYTGKTDGVQVYDDKGQYVVGTYWNNEGKWQGTSDLQLYAHWQVNEYTITFKNYNDTILQSSGWNYGTTPALEGEAPTRVATVEYSYTFKGWTPEVVAVTGNATYTAVFDSVKNVYQVTWLNTDGSELGKDSLEFGTMPEYKGEAPTKDSTAVYAYSFAGWTPNIATVTGDATYTAKFDSTKIEYNVDITIPDTIESHGSVTIDGEPTYGDTITITATPDDGYYFDGWSDGNTDNPREIEITGDTAVYPIFKECEERITYLTETIYKGQSFTFGGQELTTRGTYRDTVVLANGCDSIVVLKLNVLNSKVKFNLRVVVNDETMGTVSGTGAYVSGSEVTITATPASSKYIFVRWYNEDEGIDVYENPYTFTLTRNLQLRAVFRKAPRKTPKANNKNK